MMLPSNRAPRTTDGLILASLTALGAPSEASISVPQDRHLLGTAETWEAAVLEQLLAAEAPAAGAVATDCAYLRAPRSASE